MTMYSSRRSFLQGTGLAALALTLNAGQSVFAQAVASRPSDQPSAVLVPTVCAMCRARCTMVATVANGRVAKVEGNPASPLNGVKLCARGLAAVKQLF